MGVMSEKGCRKMFIVLVVFLLMCTFLTPISVVGIKFTGWNEKDKDIVADNWTEDMQLTDLSSIERWTDNPVVVVDGKDIHVVYNEVWQPGISFRCDLRYLRSTDYGKTWETSVNLTETNAYATSPDVAVENNNIYVVWQDYRDAPGHPEIYFRHSNNTGETWHNDTSLTSNDGETSWWSAIAVNDSNIHVVWGDKREGLLYKLYYKRGIIQENGTIVWDDGRGNVSVDRPLNVEIDGDPDIQVCGDTVHVVWYYELSDTGVCEVCYMRSDDNGYSWSDPYIVSEKDAAHSWNPKFFVQDEKIHVVWEDYKYGGYAEILYRNSTDNGNTWDTEIIRVTNTTANEYDPNVVVNGSWVWVSWWNHSDNCGYYRLSKDNGITWDYPVKLTEQSGTPILAVSDGYVHAVFTSDRTGNNEIYYKRYPKFNDPPEINSYYPETNVTITETQTQTFWVNATDQNDDTLTYQWYLNDTPLTDETNSSYTFVPEKNFSGNYSVKVSVSDGEYFANHTWIITVINVGQLQQTINELSTQLNQLIQNYTSLLENLGHLTENLTTMRSQLNETELNNTELRAIIGQLNDVISTLYSQLNSSILNTTELQSTITNLTQSLSLSNEQIATVEELLNQSLANQTELRNQIMQLNDTIISLQEQINQLKEENELMIKEREAAEERLMIAVILLIVVSLVCVLIAVSKRKR